MRIDELRLRANKPAMVQAGSEGHYLYADGRLAQLPNHSLIISSADISMMLERACEHSLYAYEKEIRSGYLTVSGGYRIGLSGQVRTQNGEIAAIPYCSGLCFRLMRQITGCADSLMPLITNASGALSTLIVSPPMMGKTTMLRDIARQLSDGVFGKKGQKVCIVDERSELGGCVLGVAQMDVGLRTDVLDGCPKAKGMSMALRTLSPEVIVTDELGSEPDALAVLEACYAGVKVIASVHGNCGEDLARRTGMALLLSRQAFERIVVLGGRPGNVRAVTDGRHNAIWEPKAS
jgi:stage III sporulation protein AA